MTRSQRRSLLDAIESMQGSQTAPVVLELSTNGENAMVKITSAPATVLHGVTAYVDSARPGYHLIASVHDGGVYIS